MRFLLAGLFVAGVLTPAVASAQAWSLAYPPLKPGTTTPDPAAPLPEWTLWQLFKSEETCQEHRALWQMVVKAEDDESIRVAARQPEDYRTQILALDHPAALRGILHYNYSVATQAAQKFRSAISEIRPKPAFTLLPIAPQRLREKELRGDEFFRTVFREGVQLAA